MTLIGRPNHTGRTRYILQLAGEEIPVTNFIRPDRTETDVIEEALMLVAGPRPSDGMWIWGEVEGAPLRLAPLDS